MKNIKLFLFSYLLTVSVLLLSGCGAEDSLLNDSLNELTSSNIGKDSQEPSEGWKDFQTPPDGQNDFQTPPDGWKNLQELPDGIMDFQGTMDASYTSLDVDNDKLYSNRDLLMNPDLTGAVTILAEDNSNYTINSEGTYIVSGNANNFTIWVEADKKDNVQLVLDDVQITNDNFPAVYIKSADKCFINLKGKNELTVTGEFITDGEINTDAVIFAKDDLTINGEGTLIIEAACGNGIAAKDELIITGGKYIITGKKDAIEANETIAICDGEFILNSDSKGIQTDTFIIIDGGIFDIAAEEGMEATYIRINNGTISIYARDDGLNATKRCDDLDVVIEVYGGELSVEAGPGDTDGFDSNGVIAVYGGIINVTGQSAFDYDRGALFDGGTIVINGEEVDEIPETMMGGPKQRMPRDRNHR